MMTDSDDFMNPDWQFNNLSKEAAQLAEALLAESDLERAQAQAELATVPEPQRLMVLEAAANRAFGREQWELARALWEQALALYRARGDYEDIHKILLDLTVEADHTGETAKSEELLLEMLQVSRKHLQPWAVVGDLIMLTDHYQRAGDPVQALHYSEESVAVARKHHYRLIDHPLFYHAKSLLVVGDVPAARQHLEEAIDVSLRRYSDRGIEEYEGWFGMLLFEMARVNALEAQTERAATLMGVAQRIVTHTEGGPNAEALSELTHLRDDLVAIMGVTAYQTCIQAGTTMTLAQAVAYARPESL